MNITLADQSPYQEIGAALGGDPLAYLFWIITLVTLVATIILIVMFAMTLQESGQEGAWRIRRLREGTLSPKEAIKLRGLHDAIIRDKRRRLIAPTVVAVCGFVLSFSMTYLVDTSTPSIEESGAVGNSHVAGDTSKTHL